MEISDITVNQQLETAVRLTTECEAFRTKLVKIQAELQDLITTRDEELSGIERASESSRSFALQQFRSQTENELSTLHLDHKTQTQSLQENHEQNTHRISARLNEQLTELEERRRSETWMLQSVLDEESNGSPVVQFDREAETYVTQKAFLDERFETIEERVTRTQEFLEQCHTSIETELPAPTVAKGNRETLRDAAVESADHVLAEADRISRLHSPQWIKGIRLWGLSFLGFVLLWIPLIAAKADLRRFVNPDIAEPDWEWSGVAAIISLSIILISSLILFYRTQNKLRAEFEIVRQHFSNARQARRLWESKSEKHIDRLENAAARWRQRLEQRRREQTEKIHSEIDHRISTLKSETENQRLQMNFDLQNRTQHLQKTLTSSQELLRKRLDHNIQQTENRISQELQADRQDCEDRFANATENLNQAARELLAAWNSNNAALRSFAQAATSQAAATRQWPGTNTDSWKLPTDMPGCISAGDILVTACKAPAAADSTEQTSQCVEMPAILRFPTDTSILVEHDSAGREAALSFLRTQILKLLTVIPAGRIRLTLIDPVGLGQSFSAMMHLTDFDELLIHSRIWTDSSQIRPAAEGHRTYGEYFSDLPAQPV